MAHLIRYPLPRQIPTGANVLPSRITLIDPIDAWLQLPGETGDFASIPDAAAFSVNPAFIIECKPAYDDWTPAGNRYCFAKWGVAGSREYRLGITGTSGSLRLLVSEDGSIGITFVSSVSPSVSDGDTLWISARFWVNGANREVEFFTKINDEDDWVQLGTTQNNAGTWSSNDTDAVVEFGTSVGGTSNFWSGKIFQCKLYDFTGGVRGDNVLSVNFEREIPGTTSFTEQGPNAATVTVNQSGDPQAEIINVEAADGLSIPIAMYHYSHH